MSTVIGIVAGEASGDLLGAHLIEALKPHLPHGRFVGIGGPRMRAVGMDALYPTEKIAVRGYVEILRHFREILAIRRRLATHFLEHPPACFIGIDAPDFNLTLEKRLKSAGIPTLQYVSPQIWAWRSERIHAIARAVDKMLTVFPFEAPLYEQARIPVAYVGHPLAEMLAEVPAKEMAREQLRLPSAARIIALLPGSRVTELEQMADLFVATALEIAANDAEVLFLVPLVSSETRALFESALYRAGSPALNLTLLFGHAHEAMAAADVVLATSGTATLEAALLRRPMVITYRMPRLSWWIMKRGFRQPYVGLPNILCGEFVVPEFLQDDATPANLAQAVLNLISDGLVCSRIDARFARLLTHLKQDTRQRLAQAVLPMLRLRAA